MFKRSISIILVLVLVFSCMTACNGNNEAKVLELTEFNIDDYDTSDIAQKTQAVKDYISSIFGKYTISGQVFSGDDMTEAVFIYSETGKLPAISGYDMGPMAWNETKTENLQKAIEWHKESNGLVEFMWSVIMPVNVNDYSKGTGRWQWDFYAYWQPLPSVCSLSSNVASNIIYACARSYRVTKQKSIK